jgi:hypothetical protein
LFGKRKVEARRDGVRKEKPGAFLVSSHVFVRRIFNFQSSIDDSVIITFDGEKLAFLSFFHTSRRSHNKSLFFFDISAFSHIDIIGALAETSEGKLQGKLTSEWRRKSR